MNNETQFGIKYFRLLLAFVISILLFSNCTVSENSLTNIEFNFGWKYRFGDLPADSNVHLTWLNTSEDSIAWTTVNNLNEIPQNKANKWLWIKTKLPASNYLGAALFTGKVDQILQVYLENELIYQYGNFTSLNENHYTSWRHHLISLPTHYTNKTIYFRIWSGISGARIDIPILLGPTSQIQRNLFISDIDSVLIALLILLFSFTLVLLYFISHRDLLFLKIALYAAVISLFILSSIPLLLTMFNASYLFFLLEVMIPFTIPIAAYLSIEHLMVQKYKTILRFSWQIHLFYLIISIILIQIIGEAFIDTAINLLLILSGLTILIIMGVFIRCRNLVATDTKILLLGNAIMLVTFLIEFLIYYNRVLLSGMSSRLDYLPYGALLFTASIIWLIIYRYNESNKHKIKVEKENLEHIIQNERLNNQLAQEKLESEKIQEMDQLKSQFLANISHEFRTPLTLILGTARQLIEENHNKIITKRSRMQEKHGKKLLNLVNNLLDLSKFDSGHMKLQTCEQDIVPLAKGIFYSFESFAKQRSVEMKWIQNTNSISLFFDRDKMESILVNLLSNAFKFTPAKGMVTMKLECTDLLEIQVKDTGLGINEKDLPHIFDRFYQASANEVAEQKGSGIGLALTRKLVELHHGEILVESETGKGSVFTVKLPLGKTHLSEEEIISKTQAPGPLTRNDINGDSEFREPTLDSGLQPLQSKKNIPIILVVEDNTDLRNYIREVMNEKYIIHEASNGRSGFKQAAEIIPDLIISDVMMPKMDGYQLCDKLKTDERTSHIPVILLTARSGKESRIAGLQQGADDYLVKPFDSDELKVRVMNLIEQRKKLKERYRDELLFGQNSGGKTSSDQAFIERAAKTLDKHLQNPKLDIHIFAREIGLSRSQLHRKLQGLLNQSASEFIRSLRLKKAAEMLKAKTASVSEVAYQTGFNNLSYFSKCFKAQYGVTPSEFENH